MKVKELKLYSETGYLSVDAVANWIQISCKAYGPVLGACHYKKDGMKVIAIMCEDKKGGMIE